MPEYKCELCDFYCQRPGQLRRHNESDRHKANMLPIIENELTQVKIQQLEQVQTQQDTIEDLLKRVQLLEDRLQPRNNQQNNNCTVNNTQNNININLQLSTTPFGQENWGYISDKEMLKIMGGVNSCIPTIVERLHFDTEHPENHNIRIQNKARSEIKVFDGKMWRTQDRNNTVDEMIENIRGRLDDYEDKFLTESSSGLSFKWENYWKEMDEAKKKKELRKKVIGRINDCQEHMTKHDMILNRNR
tara:strand:- start:6798 stop:7535 length:738 start_codon:yes stop_codon:yes gene_type:complete